MRKLLFALAMLAPMLPFRSAPTLAQGPAGAGRLDHLVCYDVNDKLKPGIAVDLKTELQPEFNQAGCTVVKVTKFCVPATKTVLPPAAPGLGIVGQPLRDDYICYQIKCPNGVDIADKLVADQFGQRRQEKFKPFELCAPARKSSPPCFRIGTSKQCGGVCPNDPAGGPCRFDKQLQDCTCEPLPCGGKPDTTGHCGGECTDPAQTCLPGLNAAGKPECICQDPPPPPCGLNPATGTCGGSCRDQAAICVFVTTPNGPDCICQPPEPDCMRDAAGQCGGSCPSGFECKLNTVINDCRCEPPSQPCGPNPFTGQCGGDCPPDTQCRFVSTPGSTPTCDCVAP